nr:hypothetical protein SYMBAF_50427 [Serratia symbiotica]
MTCRESPYSTIIFDIQTDPINNMLIDLMAAMSHKDWLSRRQRQK